MQEGITIVPEPVYGVEEAKRFETAVKTGYLGVLIGWDRMGKVEHTEKTGQKS